MYIGTYRKYPLAAVMVKQQVLHPFLVNSVPGRRTFSRKTYPEAEYYRDRSSVYPLYYFSVSDFQIDFHLARIVNWSATAVVSHSRSMTSFA
jgi:hypothetical protein